MSRIVVASAAVRPPSLLEKRTSLGLWFVGLAIGA